MGRAIVRKPAVFLFDEPLSNLDAKLRVQMRLEIKALQKELGVTSLYVTHDQVEAMTLADRMIVMNAGNADQIGAPLEVYNDPQSTFVAGFIGSPPMNFLNNLFAQNQQLDSSAQQAIDRLLTDLPTEVSATLQQQDNDNLTIGIRPEHLSLCEPPTAHLIGKVKYTEPLGAETLLYIEVQNQQTITLRQAGDIEIPAAGDSCFIRMNTALICLFDSKGKRIQI
jgi:sn-glycerol 3-phosphate transport system ATP-binding protein